MLLFSWQKSLVKLTPAEQESGLDKQSTLLFFEASDILEAAMAVVELVFSTKQNHHKQFEPG